jgi:hypothetical protein
MKKPVAILSFLVMSFLIGPSPANAALGPGDAGVGAILGTNTGPTFKYWLSRTRAFDVGLGLGDDVVFYADYLWHGWDVVRRPENGVFAGYLGVGPRYEERKKDDDIGVRFVAGGTYLTEGYPVEIFFEIAPVLEVAPDLDSDFDAGLGVRYYFTGL